MRGLGYGGSAAHHLEARVSLALLVDAERVSRLVLLGAVGVAAPEAGVGVLKAPVDAKLLSRLEDLNNLNVYAKSHALTLCSALWVSPDHASSTRE